MKTTKEKIGYTKKSLIISLWKLEWDIAASSIQTIDGIYHMHSSGSMGRWTVNRKVEDYFVIPRETGIKDKGRCLGIQIHAACKQKSYDNIPHREKQIYAQNVLETTSFNFCCRINVCLLLTIF